jgi:hypothetical protein
MGLDVFGVFQKREKERWVSFQSYYYGERDELRNWLGLNLEGGYEIKPIAQPRGLPADFDVDEFVGEHSKSWLLADEILNALPALATSTEKISIKTYFEACNKEPDLRKLEDSIEEIFIKEYFDRRKKEFNLEEWENFKNYRSATGRCLIRLVAASTMPFDVTFTSEYGFVDCIYDFSDYFQRYIDEIRRLKNKYGEVRFVFGFS